MQRVGQPGDLTLNFSACDNVNGNAYTSTGKEILLVNNTDTIAHTFTISSVVDSRGRSDTSLSTYSVAAGGFAVIYTNTLQGWRRNTGQIFLACNSNLVKFAAVQLQH